MDAGDALPTGEPPAVGRLPTGEQLLVEAEGLARIGAISWEVGREALSISAGLRQVFDGMLDDPPTVTGFLEAMHGDDRAPFTEVLQRAIHRREAFQVDFRLAGDADRWLRAFGRAAGQGDGLPPRIAGICQDVTDERAADARRERADADLAAQQRVLEGIARGEPVESTLVALCDEIEARYPGARCTVLVADRESGTLVHIAGPSMPPSVIEALDGMPIAVGMGACGTAAARKEAVVVEDILVDPLAAPFRDLAQAHDLRSVWSDPLVDGAGNVLGTFAVYRDVPHRPAEGERRTVAAAGHLAALAIERHLNEQALTDAARVDPLTGLPNRTQFLEELAWRLNASGTPVGVMFLDLDRFKWINDSLGHPAGDRVLVEVARRLRAVARSTDLVARFGGDEFTLLVSAPGQDELAAIARRVENALRSPFELDGGEFFLTASVGIACNDHPGDASDLVRDADTAMYAAKEGGRARHAMFDERLRERAVARVHVEADLRRALDRHEIGLHHQPIFEVGGSRRCVGVEALARWHPPTGGPVPPDRFIPVAEETGLIVPLGLQVLDDALEQAAKWWGEGHRLSMCVNVSALQLVDPDFVLAVARLLQGHGLPPSALTVEVTESAVMEQLDLASRSLRALVDLGSHVAIDDFGTGYSSIARLGELPVGSVKIDRRFTSDLGRDARAAAVLSAITDLAHALGLLVVAEGVEDDAALAAVAEAGCDLAQGYHLARPGPAEDVVEHFDVVAGG